MSSTRTVPRTTTITKTSSVVNTHHTNGSANSYDINDSTVNSEFDSNVQRSVLTKNTGQPEGIYRNPRLIHAITSGLVGQPVVIQTNESERYHGILETISPNGDVMLSIAHRIDNNNNDIMSLSTSLIDLFDTVDNSVPTFELQKRIIQASNIVEMIALDNDLSGSGKCVLDETPKVNQLEDDRFNRMEHFYGTDEIDPETLEDLDLGDDGKAGYDPEDMFHTNREKFNTKTDFDESKYTYGFLFNWNQFIRRFSI
jgi:small nuclear ribonucleoprotein (snRNP)-like protein